ncbi:hypothetical protein Tco_0523948 [Tanacetum coccineum]
MDAVAMKHIASNFAKLDKFEGVDVRRWQKKMRFLLSSMTVVVSVILFIPDYGDDATVDQLRKRAKMLNISKNCRIPWRPNIWLRMHQVSCIIDKLPPSWKDFKHILKHLKEELTLVELGSHLRIEWVDSGATVHVCKDRCWLNILNDNIGSAFMSTFKLNESIIWRARLDHVHFKRMQDMSKDGLIPAFDMDTEKCKTRMLTKITKKPFQNIKRKTKVLELIHSDLCDFHATLSLRNKKYFVNFIDDASREVARLLDPKLKTLSERGIKCNFVGYAEHSKALRFYVIEPNESVSINSIIESRDAIFNENRFSSVPKPSLRILNRTEDTGTRDEVSNQHSYCFNVEDDPKTFDKAMKSQDVTFCKEAINDEMDSIMGNNTWVLADLPPSCKPFSCK